jgi:hypothetical protein
VIMPKANLPPIGNVPGEGNQGPARGGVVVVVGLLQEIERASDKLASWSVNRRSISNGL